MITPSGTTTIVISMTINAVPNSAGKMPPSVFDSRGSPPMNSAQRDR